MTQPNVGGGGGGCAGTLGGCFKRKPTEQKLPSVVDFSHFETHPNSDGVASVDEQQRACARNAGIYHLPTCANRRGSCPLVLPLRKPLSVVWIGGNWGFEP